MKYTITAIAIAATLLRFSAVMAQAADCQKKCVDAFIKCSGACASSADASCGANCFRERDSCTKGCASDNAKPAPADREKKADADKKSDTDKKVKPDEGDNDADIEDDAGGDDDDADINDDGDIDDDSGTIDEPDDMDNAPDDMDSPDVDEENL